MPALGYLCAYGLPLCACMCVCTRVCADLYRLISVHGMGGLRRTEWCLGVTVVLSDLEQYSLLEGASGWGPAAKP